jgi:hypothetical protein
MRLFRVRSTLTTIAVLAGLAGTAISSTNAAAQPGAAPIAPQLAALVEKADEGGGRDFDREGGEFAVDAPLTPVAVAGVPGQIGAFRRFAGHATRYGGGVGDPQVVEPGWLRFPPNGGQGAYVGFSSSRLE